MKNLLTSIAFLMLIGFTAKADRFIYKGDTVSFDVNSPLEQHPHIQQIRQQLKGFKGEYCFDCYNRPYIAEWTVIGQQLYLTGIYSQGVDPGLKADINKLFNTTAGRVKADWVTTDLWVPHGKLVRMCDMMQPLYPAELHFFITNGKIITIKEFNYPNTTRIYDNRDGEAQKAIYSQINWDKLPVLNGGIVKVCLSFTSGASGKPENVKTALNTGTPPYADEAIRIISALPWSGDYWHGEVHPLSFSIPVVFSDENRKKYKH